MSDGQEDRRRYLPSPLRVREQAHRRAILLGMAALIVLSTSPVFGHHLATRAEVLLAGRDHFLGFCLVALHQLLAPVHLVFHVLILAGVAYATWDRARAWLELRRVLGPLAWRPPADADVLAAARLACLAADRIRIVAGLPDPAFTVGWWRPRVYVSAELPQALALDELAAVLAHEAAHVARRDPLRLSLLRFLACTLFFLPALRRLADDAADEAEIAADDAAAAAAFTRAPLALASAIVHIATCWGRPSGGAGGDARGPVKAAVGFHRVDLLDRRVRRLMGEEATVGTHVTRRSLVGAGAALVAIWASGLMMTHPLRSPSETDQPLRHCDHPGRLALTHLFCRGMHGLAGTAPCPHATR